MNGFEPSIEDRTARLERVVRCQWLAIGAAVVLGAILATSGASSPSTSAELPAEIDTLHVKNEITVGEYPNQVTLQAGDSMGAWVWVRAGKTRSAFVHVPLAEHGQPTFAIHDGEYQRNYK